MVATCKIFHTLYFALIPYLQQNYSRGKTKFSAIVFSIEVASYLTKSDEQWCRVYRTVLAKGSTSQKLIVGEVQDEKLTDIWCTGH